jgi:hypothetical protein
VYQQWGQRIDELTSHGGRVDDVSLVVGSPPTRCDAVTASSPSIGASIGPQQSVVRSVIPGGPAAQAGLRSGDTITSIAGQPVASFEQARSAFTSSAREGQPLELGTNRGNFSVVPKMPKLEQCYWDVQAGQVSRSSAYVSPSSGYAGGSANQRFFRASCRISDGFLSGCQWNWQQ